MRFLRIFLDMSDIAYTGVFIVLFQLFFLKIFLIWK
jgi:hypothetical protein